MNNERKNYYCDWCDVSLIEKQTVKDRYEGYKNIEVLKHDIINEKHISLGIVSFCSMKCYKKYWKDRDLYRDWEQREVKKPSRWPF